MYKGYLNFGGREIVNAARTQAYVENSDAPIPLQSCWDVNGLREALGDQPYTSPLADDAPWFDPNNLATARFYGVYPLDIQGIEDSTASAEVQESIVEGGSIGQERRSTRSIRVKAMLLANDDAAMTAGMSWLDAALAPSPCDDHGAGTCGGTQLCYFVGRPEVGRCFELEYSDTFTQPIVTTTPASSPTVFQEHGYSGIWKGELALTFSDGAIIEWGAVDQADTASVVERHGPVLLRRMNHVAVSTFEGAGSGGGGYWTAFGGGSLTYPDFEGEEVMARASGATLVTTRSDDIPGQLGPVTASVELTTEDPTATAELRVRKVVGDTIIASAVFLIGEGWQRFSVPAPDGQDVYLELATTGTVYANRWQLEGGSIPTPYLNGAMSPSQAAGEYFDPSQSGAQYLVEWLGEPYLSPSRMTFIGRLWIGAETSVDTFEDARAGTCDTYPWLNVVQGSVQGELHVALRAEIPVEQQVLPYERTLHGVKRTSGPAVMSEQYTHEGGVIRFVDFVLVATKPGRYSTPTDLMIDQQMSALPTVPVWDVNCEAPAPVVIIDPDCPPVPAPPGPPIVPNSCVTPETAWQRYWLSIPESLVSAWSKTNVQITVRSGAQEIRQVRVRAYPNPFTRDPSGYLFTRANRAANTALRLDAAGWSNLGSVGTATGRLTTGTPYADVNFYRATASGAHAADTFGPVSGGAGLNLLEAGEEWRPSIEARSSVGRNVKMSYAYIDGAGAQIGATSYGPVTAVTANTWTRLKLAGTAPLTAPANTERVLVGVVGDTAAWANGQTLDATTPNIDVRNEWPGPVPVTDAWWDAFRVDAAGDPLPADGLYYGWVGDEGVGASIGMTSPVDPCSFCAEFIVSYLPANTELTVDSILERSYASIAGQPGAPANHLLYSGDGAPITWPELTCGQEYLLAIDVPEPLLDDVFVSVALATKE